MPSSYGFLLLNDEETPKFAQLYIYDIRNEVKNRLAPFVCGSATSSLDNDIVHGFMNILDNTYDLARIFCYARERLGFGPVSDYKLCLLGKRDSDSRQYDDRSSNDIGGLIVGDIG